MSHIGHKNGLQRRDKKIQTDSQKPLGTESTVTSVALALTFMLILVVFISTIGITRDISLLAALLVIGTLTLTDTISMLRQKIDILSPRALVSMLLFHTLALSPIMHLRTGYYPRWIAFPQDPEQAFNLLTWICIPPVLIYFVAVVVLEPHAAPYTGEMSASVHVSREDSALEAKTYRNIFLAGGIVSLSAFGFLVMQQGGPASWLTGQFHFIESGSTSGWILALSEAFPLLFFVSAIMLGIERKLLPPVNRKGWKRTSTWPWTSTIAIFAVYVATVFITSGLRGSRANVVWPLLFAILLLHFLNSRIRRSFLFLGAMLVGITSVFYDVYKQGGLEQLKYFLATGNTTESHIVFGLDRLLLDDFSRSGMQAILAETLQTDPYNLALGRTYIGDIAEVIPGVSRSSLFPPKSIFATDILYGEGAVAAGTEATRIFGLFGEAMLNFGFIGPILGMIVFIAFLRTAIALFSKAMEDHDLFSSILASIFVPAVLLLYLSDLDNVMIYLSRRALPVLVLALFAQKSFSRLSRRYDKI